MKQNILVTLFSLLVGISYAQSTTRTPNVLGNEEVMERVNVTQAWMNSVTDTVSLQYLSKTSVNTFDQVKNQLTVELTSNGISEENFRIECYKYMSTYRFFVEAWGKDKLKIKKIVKNVFPDAFFFDMQKMQRSSFDVYVE